MVRMQSARENIAPNPLVQGLKHLASLDGASAWWFAKVNKITLKLSHFYIWWFVKVDDTYHPRYFELKITFPQVLIGNFTDGNAMGCTEDIIMAGFVLCVITLAIRFLMFANPLDSI